MHDIMIVDDNPMMCQSLAGILAAEGLRVVTFHHPAVAIDYAVGHPVDVAIVDIRLPDMDGFQFIDGLRRLRPNVRTLMVSTHYDDEEGVARAIVRRHCDGAFSKPFSIKRLLTAVLGLLGDSAAESCPVPS